MIAIDGLKMTSFIASFSMEALAGLVIVREYLVLQPIWLLPISRDMSRSIQLDG
jgi:hypothetical protein